MLGFLFFMFLFLILTILLLVYENNKYENHCSIILIVCGCCWLIVGLNLPPGNNFNETRRLDNNWRKILETQKIICSREQCWLNDRGYEAIRESERILESK